MYPIPSVQFPSCADQGFINCIHGLFMASHNISAIHCPPSMLLFPTPKIMSEYPPPGDKSDSSKDVSAFARLNSSQAMPIAVAPDKVRPVELSEIISTILFH